MRNLFAVIMTLVLCISGCGESRNTEINEQKLHSDTVEINHSDEVPSADEHDIETAEHEDEVEIGLDEEAMKLAGITLAEADTGRIGIRIQLSGEIGFDEDRLVHATPRFPGIIREARFRVGDWVHAGDVIATIESNESMTQYSMKAPISGRIIRKHASLGEYVSPEESIYWLADLSSVWVNLAVYSEDGSKIRAGQKVTVFALDSKDTAGSTIHFVTPFMDEQTRRLTARVVLPNRMNTWRPGSFVNALVEAGEGEEGILIHKDAVQVLDDRNVVFVQHEPNRFRPVEVTVGESDLNRIRILSGLERGTEYVNHGAFELKAKIVTGSLGAHAGHNH